MGARRLGRPGLERRRHSGPGRRSVRRLLPPPDTGGRDPRRRLHREARGLRLAAPADADLGDGAPRRFMAGLTFRELEDVLTGLSDKAAKLGKLLDVEAKRKEIAERESEAAEPAFWADSARAKK